jgi:hypothetical protein
MRKQLEKLVQFTENLQDEIIRLNVPTQDKLDVSEYIKVYTASKNDFIMVTYSNFPNKVDVSVHKMGGKKYITTNVSLLDVTDEDLDLIMMRSDVEIYNFVKDLEASTEKRRVDQIAYHLKQIEELQGDVQDS